MKGESLPGQYRIFADNAINTALIGMLRMAAEAGNPAIFEVAYASHCGQEPLSVYGIYLGEDSESVTVFTGRPGELTLTLSKKEILSIKPTPPQEIVRSLNALGSWSYFFRVSQATAIYLLQSYHQWSQLLGGIQQGVAWPTAGTGLGPVAPRSEPLGQA